MQEQGTVRTGSVGRRGELVGQSQNPASCRQLHFVILVYFVCLCPLHWISTQDIHWNHPESFKKSLLGPTKDQLNQNLWD